MKPNHLSTWAVFSTFRPGMAAEAAVASVAAQVDGVLVVDDGSGASADEVLARITANGAIVQRRSENGGIAAALNAGIRAARERGAEFVITFDQDSLVPEGFVSALHAARSAAESDGVRVGAVVAEYFAEVRQARGAITEYGQAANVIQSGMLLPLSVIRALGDLRADYFIDLVDTEYELRLRRAHYAVIAAPGVLLGHALGTQYRRELFGRPVRLLGIPPEITLSTPFRYFYRVRNRLVLNREYLRWAPHQIIRDTVLDVIHFANALWVASPRPALWRIYRAAVTAFVRGRMGRMPEGLESIAQVIEWRAPLHTQSRRMHPEGE